ncbi:hypothetical protein C8Q80DRAFT_152386 [Daedaleopsis nitida]|nr:hypothetical protein C8Q80DRAFT_152386 [Daedaleopsis nitida]
MPPRSVGVSRRPPPAQVVHESTRGRERRCIKIAGLSTMRRTSTRTRRHPAALSAIRLVFFSVIMAVVQTHPSGNNEHNWLTGIQLVCVRVPRTFPIKLLFAKKRNSWIFTGFRPFSISFSADGNGAPLCAIMEYYRKSPIYLENRGLLCRYHTGIFSCIWLHISWPGYEAYTHTLLIDHDGTYGSIAYGVAQAYADFLESAVHWDFQVDTENPDYTLGLWRITNGPSALFDICTLRLVSLNHITANIFQAEIDLATPSPA